jgi:YesN/AraC family two-component response regulator
VGYEDSGFFRKLFIKYTGLRPSDYRLKFRRSACGCS